MLGRLREDPALPNGIKYILVSHNTRMGAAKEAILVLMRSCRPLRAVYPRLGLELDFRLELLARRRGSSPCW